MTCPSCGRATDDMVCQECLADSWWALVAAGCPHCAGAIGGTCPACGRDVNAAVAGVEERSKERAEA